MEVTTTKKDFSNSEIEQLNRILASSIINSSGILSGFLEFVGTETLAGREQEIKEYYSESFHKTCQVHEPDRLTVQA